jgi:hypothetical protein
MNSIDAIAAGKNHAANGRCEFGFSIYAPPSVGCSLAAQNRSESPTAARRTLGGLNETSGGPSLRFGIASNRPNPTVALGATGTDAMKLPRRRGAGSNRLPSKGAGAGHAAWGSVRALPEERSAAFAPAAQASIGTAIIPIVQARIRSLFPESLSLQD